MGTNLKRPGPPGSLVWWLRAEATGNERTLKPCIPHQRFVRHATFRMTTSSRPRAFDQRLLAAVTLHSSPVWSGAPCLA
eukprot:1112438-Pelagomonas_calceolata.AAC.2